MAVKLIGTDIAGGSSSLEIYVQGSQFTCDLSGTINAIKVYPLVNRNVRVAIYSDSGLNTINLLLKESASVAVTTGDWRSVSLSSALNIVAGTKYWLVFQTELDGGCAYRSLPNTRLRGYKSQAYGAFPANGSGFGYDDDYEYSLQGWGTIAVSRSFGLIIE